MTPEEKENKRLKKKLKKAKALIQELQFMIDDYKRNYIKKPPYRGPRPWF